MIIDLGADLPPVPGDRVQLQQVILNLLINAIEAMSPVEDQPRELPIQSCRHGAGSVWLRSETLASVLIHSRQNESSTPFIDEVQGHGAGAVDQPVDC